MTTILIWLGSGFAFAVGVFVGAAMMRWLRRMDSEAQKESLALMKERNLLDADRNEFLEAIHFELQKIREANGGDV